MNAIEKISDWGDTHHPKWMGVLRMALGLILVYKGIQFGQNSSELKILTENPDWEFWSLFLVHYIIMVHFAAGALIAIGLITRVAIAFQLPIVLGAVILWGKQIEFIGVFSQFGFATMILVLLILFLVEGSGTLSMDEYLKHHTGNQVLKMQ